MEQASIEDFGLHEWLGQKDTTCIVEWPENLVHIPDVPHLKITFDFIENNKTGRILNITTSE